MLLSHVIYTETLIPIHVPSTVQINQSINPPSTRIEILDFNQSYWPKPKDSINTIEWRTTFRGTSVIFSVNVAIDTISENELCLFHPNSAKSLRGLS